MGGEDDGADADPGEGSQLDSWAGTQVGDAASDRFPVHLGVPRMSRSLSFLFVSIAVAGCGPKTPDANTTPRGGSSDAPAAAGDALTGPVLEQLAASPYVYLRIRTSQGEVWAAVPEATVETGSVVTVSGAMLMTNFESATLKRTFDRVYFGTLGPEGSAMAGSGGDPHAGVGRQPAPVDVGTVEKATGADAHTVAEIWAQKAALEGKTVTLRGVVVKANNGVMGKNWIHLQDGSGDAAQGTNDMTVTSGDQAATGATITVKGTVRTGKDFGAGYVYPVLVEDARIVK